MKKYQVTLVRRRKVSRIVEDRLYLPVEAEDWADANVKALEALAAMDEEEREDRWHEDTDEDPVDGEEGDEVVVEPFVKGIEEVR